jgi:signal transduction histidine kinase
MGEGLTVLRVRNAGADSDADVIDVADVAGALTTLEERSVDGVFLPADRVAPDLDILRDHHPNLPVVVVGQRPDGTLSEHRERALRTAADGDALASLRELLAQRDAESALSEHRGLRRAVGRIAADTATQEDAASVVETALERLLSTDRFRFGFGAQGRDDGSVLEFPGSDALEFKFAGSDATIDDALAGTETVVIEDSDPPAIVVPIGGDRGLVLFTDDDTAPGPGERSVLQDLATLLRSRGTRTDSSAAGDAGSAERDPGAAEANATGAEEARDAPETEASDEEPPAEPTNAEAGQRESDVLIEMLAHELRSPLDLGRGRLEMAVEEGSEEDIERAIETFDRIDDVVSAGVSLARLEPGEEEPVDLADRARSVWDDTATASASLEIDDEESLPTVAADPSLLDRLLSNLFRNAVEHGRQPASADGGAQRAPDGPTVRLGPLDDGVGFFVSDDGEGIDPADRDRILEPGVSLSDDGTGYGLAIVDRVATAHGWDVSVGESTEGGARFDIQTA